MRINERKALSTSKVLLVPYEPHHVLHYHSWMQDPDIQEATASEPLSIEEEYSNQLDWRTSTDKLTFILCQPLDPNTAAQEIATGGLHDTDEKMIGDINFFLYPHPLDEDYSIGELDIMVAEKSCRRTGVGRSACSAILVYIQEHVSDILTEYAEDGNVKPLKEVMVKIKEGNQGSRKLFEGLGFKDDGEGVNYFGEVRMVMVWEEVERQPWYASALDETVEMPYECKVDESQH